MKLMDHEVAAPIPGFDALSENATPLYVRYDLPLMGWSWRVAACKPIEDGDYQCFGLVKNGDCEEWGFFRISELEALQDWIGGRVMRDESFTPYPVMGTECLTMSLKYRYTPDKPKA